MRFSVIETIYKAGLKDPNLCFITGDLGHMNTAEFRRDFAGRFWNAGMSEQNIIGMAAGLALSGKQAVAYSIVPFITLRCYEQIKVDVCDHNANVIIVGVGGGFAYGSAGPTHYSIEEVAALRVLPNMKIVCPVNPTETRVLTEQILRAGGPAYIRIGRGKEQDFELGYVPVLGKAGVLRAGTDMTIIASGTIGTEALRVADMLQEKGFSVEVANMHTIKPIDADFIADRAKSRRAIFTLEEHSVLGGLGGAVAEVLAELPARPLFKRFGVADIWPEVVGSQQYLRDHTGISAEKVALAIKRILS
ncbi:MAG: transketolase C-terminal domain-containing protein [Patescibacteria group bacterium]